MHVLNPIQQNFIDLTVKWKTFVECTGHKILTAEPCCHVMIVIYIESSLEIFLTVLTLHWNFDYENLNCISKFEL